MNSKAILMVKTTIGINTKFTNFKTYMMAT